MGRVSQEGRACVDVFAVQWKTFHLYFGVRYENTEHRAETFHRISAKNFLGLQPHFTARRDRLAALHHTSPSVVPPSLLVWLQCGSLLLTGMAE